MAQLTETHRICVYQLSDKCPKKQYKVTLEASKNRLKFLHNCESLTDIRINFFYQNNALSKRYDFFNKAQKCIQVTIIST